MSARSWFPIAPRPDVPTGGAGPGGLKNAIDSVWLSFGFRSKLEKARAAGELPPGMFRARAALATARA
jgi:hypothetical protein